MAILVQRYHVVPIGWLFDVFFTVDTAVVCHASLTDFRCVGGVDEYDGHSYQQHHEATFNC
ncbi:hypothetical protein [Vagococcus xieshaowenii]|uniref:hypothetical protein n=1 Tax=Vagococcus xieshaowenii TaxID=2562451 RepID=UPI0010759FF2|nr:hypothetical protein [Vagococcus xieshaowenii]